MLCIKLTLAKGEDEVLHRRISFMLCIKLLSLFRRKLRQISYVKFRFREKIPFSFKANISFNWFSEGGSKKILFSIAPTRPSSIKQPYILG